jgi:hypothetical protein
MRVVRKTHANYGAVGQDAAGRSIFDSMSAINKKSHAEAQRRREPDEKKDGEGEERMMASFIDFRSMKNYLSSRRLPLRLCVSARNL